MIVFTFVEVDIGVREVQDLFGFERGHLVGSEGCASGQDLRLVGLSARLHQGGGTSLRGLLKWIYGANV